MNEAQKAFLLDMAKRYIWWKTPNEVILHPQRVLAQVMNLGVWGDLCKLDALFSEQELLDVLKRAEAGWLNERSWYFWHCCLMFGEEVPPMPGRAPEK
jgi:hypothetical protein